MQFVLIYKAHRHLRIQHLRNLTFAQSTTAHSTFAQRKISKFEQPNIYAFNKTLLPI